jgi:hypothetical protein
MAKLLLVGVEPLEQLQAVKQKKVLNRCSSIVIIVSCCTGMRS